MNDYYCIYSWGNNPIKNTLLGYSPCYYWDIPHGTLNASIWYMLITYYTVNINLVLIVMFFFFIKFYFQKNEKMQFAKEL